MPRRKMFSNVYDAVNDINSYITFSNVSVSVWWYKETEQKYEGNGDSWRPSRVGPKYSTAITDKLFFDIDCLDKQGNIISDRLEKFHNLWDWTISKDLKRDICFTGGGFQCTVGANVSAQNYTSVYNHLKNKFRIVDDEYATLEKMRRVPGSYNWGNDKKSDRNLFCIPLTDEEVFQEFDDIRKLAKKQRQGFNILGREVYTPSSYITQNMTKVELDRRSDFDVSNELGDILSSYGLRYTDICPNIRQIIEQPHVKHYQRIEVIKYLKSIYHIKYGDMVILLPKLLTAPHGQVNDGMHSVIEKQPDSVFKNNHRFNPTVMRRQGYCDSDCFKCDEYMKVINEYV